MGKIEDDAQTIVRGLDGWIEPSNRPTVLFEAFLQEIRRQGFCDVCVSNLVRVVGAVLVSAVCTFETKPKSPPN